MIYKILVLKNGINIDVNDECKKTIQFFAKHNIQVQFDFRYISIPTDYKTYRITQGFNSTTGQPMQINNCGLVDSVKDTVRTLVKEGECNAVMFVNDISNIPTIAGIELSNWTNFLPLYMNTDYIQLVYNPYLKQIGEVQTAILHEPMHAFCYALNRYGFSVHDCMDIDSQGRPYYLNDTPDNPDSNFSQTFRNIAPYLDKLVPQSPTMPPQQATSPQVTIGRISDDGVQTLGELVMAGFKCKTLERPYKNNLPNISCIPKGVYNCRYTFSLRMLKYTYELQGTGSRSGIRIHSGNFFFDIAGCILLGDSYADINHDGKCDILNSKATIKKFEEIMQKKDFTLKII